ncbi:universal stress protein [Nocardia sp. BMG51109]|uniref:universal stress protein n=1 Tax=Nocardia sp. BMG51109 TaxID=1056816 RepID=UPI0004672717|nr:universal stress protein [Nocardia sp. BMG51109]
MSDSTMPGAEPNPPIVAAVDGSAVSQHAAAWAAADAALYGCELHLVTSVSIPVGFGPVPVFGEDDLGRMRAVAEQALTEASRSAGEVAAGVRIRTEVTTDPIIPHLLELSRRARALVLGSRGLGAFRRGLLGSVGTAVTRHAYCPVAVVHSTSAIDPVSASRPVLVGVDGSDNSVPALELAFEEASRRKAGLVALHAWTDVSAGLDVSIMGWDAIEGSEDAVLGEALAGYAERFPDVPVRRILVRDRPVRSLLEESEDAQLVVVGSHGRGGFTGMLLGSTSSALLQSVECPIIVVRAAKDGAGTTN